jgi:hypothetical protein
MARSRVTALRWVWCAYVALMVVAQVAQGQAKREAELVFLRDGGFFHATITRPPGEFLLVVKNRSRSADQMTLGLRTRTALQYYPKRTSTFGAGNIL